MKPRLRINRLISLLLINTLLLPVIFLDLNHTISARTNFTPPKQSAPNSAPPEPYIISNSTNSVTMFPTLATLGTTISTNYSTMATFINGAETPQGLGAATPPPTFTERLTGFFASLFVTKEINSEPAAPLVAGAAVAFDFDGDSRADFSRWQANSFQYKIYNSNSEDYTTLNLGSSSSKIAPADFDGDGKFDMAVFSAGAWTIRKSSTNTNWSVTWGTTGDLPVAADYDGDHTADFAIYRPSTNTFWVLTSGSGYASYTSTALGTSGDIVVPGDFDGDGKADCAVFRPSNGHWYHLPSSGGSLVDVAWGVSTDIPAPGDFDSDGKTDRTVFRPSTGTWYVYKSSGGSPNYFEKSWGNLGDQPVPADYDGDATSDIAIYRPTTGAWWILTSGSGFKDSMVFNLGTSSDTAVPSAYLKQSGAELYPDQLSPARLAPINATGGTNYYSRNSAWGTGLVSLPGRSGLNLNIGMGYNSLVWTKVGSVMAFDMDHSNVSPGFNLGFPRIEPAYVSSQTSTLSYLMVAPSGGRTEFRQTAAGDTYETADSSYAQVKVNNPVTANNPTPIEDITLTVTGTDGTNMSYSWIGNAYRCTQIKDSNGNYITISNNTDGQLTSVTDTLGRVVTVNYDSYSRPSSITQNWQTNNGQSSTTTTHTWATFTYTTRTIGTSFYNLSVFGPANDTSISVLQKVTYSDGSYTKFDHNGYAQVYKISSYAANDDQLNYVWRNIESPSSNQTDCPRFTQTKTKVANFNLDQYGAPQEIVVNNSITASQSYSLPNSISGTATKIEIAMEDDPYDSVTKIYVGSSGWNEALPIATEDYADEGSSLTRKRWTWSNWTQDNTSASYIINPRVTETRVGDTSNTKKTEIDYYLQTGTNIATYGLVKEVRVYDSNLSTVLKTSKTEYNTNTAYISRRIIGLPSKSELYEGTSTLMSKVTFAYDEGNFSDSGLSQNISPVQHDNTNYGSSFITGRGNPTSTTRWDANDPTDSSDAVTSSVKYNTAGSAVAQISPWTSSSTRQVKITYADKFNDGNDSRNTYAYPTKIYDPADNFSEVKYRFDIGANVEAQSPTPQGSQAEPNEQGKKTTRIFDSIGRLEKETIVNSGAYTRYEYPTNGVQSKVYSTLIDVDGDSNIAEDEVLSESWTDGAGRVRQSRTPMTFDSSGNTTAWSGVLTEYDILGRVKRSSVPTEINSSWNPAGDDYTRGWLWTYQKYDWKSRVVRIINTDGTDSSTLNDSDQLFSYDGCGCAGGQVTTVQSESVPIPGTSNSARRTQKVYEDILGRAYKTEVMEWNGTTPYTTTVQTFNGRDQVTNTRQYSGSTSSSTFQDVTMTYDGHGRMASRHYPIEDSGASTTWVYNKDDSIEHVTDPRSASTSFTYNSRALVTDIDYTPPSSSTVPDTPSVDFTYDAAGNRTSMTTAGISVTDYTYDELSRMTSETIDFDGLSTDLTIGYTYHLGGALKSITDPFDSTVNNTNDKTGKLRAVAGTPYAQNTTGNYANNIQYRAFGGIKQMDYTLPDHTAEIKLEYDNRLRADHSELVKNSTYLMKADFSYFADSRVQAKDDLLADQWDRTMQYDHAGRLTFNQFNMGPNSDNTGMKLVYEQTIGYDHFSNMTSRGGVHWDNDISFSATYTNGRKDAYGSQVINFDAAGNMLHFGENSVSYNFQDNTFDAAGRRTVYYDSVIGNFSGSYSRIQQTEMKYISDGDGRPVIEKRAYRSYNYGETPPALTSNVQSYQVWSTVLGSSLTTLNPDGTKLDTKVFAGGTVIGKQQMDNSIEWRTSDPVTGTTGILGYSSEGTAFYTEETEPLGQKIHPHDPVDPPEPTLQNRLFSADDPEWQCDAGEKFWGGPDGTFGGMPWHCQYKGMMDKAINGDTLWKVVSSNPKDVDMDSPFPEGFMDSASDEVLSYASNITGKTPYGESRPCPRGKVRRNGKCVTPKKEKPLAVVDVPIPADLTPIDLSVDNWSVVFKKIGTFVDFAYRNISFVDSGQGYAVEKNENRQAVMDTFIWMMINKACVDAFKKAGVPSLAEAVGSRGVVVAARGLLNYSKYNERLGITEGERKKANIMFNDSEGMTALTQNPVDRNRSLKVYFDEDAFSDGESDKDTVHEGIHVAGKVSAHYAVYTPSGPVRIPFYIKHDLEGLTGYDEILKHCVRP